MKFFFTKNLICLLGISLLLAGCGKSSEKEETPISTEKEKEIARAQMSGKPPEIIEKIVMGKINKWYSEVCLIKQPWLRDDKKNIEKLYPGIKIRRFIRWEVGKGE